MKIRPMKRSLLTTVLVSAVMLGTACTAGAMGGGGMMDTTPPVISNILPTGIITATSTTVSATYSDSGMMASGINASTATLAVSGGTVSGCTATSSQISCTASGLADGSHTITVSVKDNKGNLATSTGAFTLAAGPDTTAPSVTNLQPSGTITATSATVSADYSDAGSGINAATAILTVSGATVSGCTADAAHIVCSASGLAIGTHTISVTVADQAGNTASASSSFDVTDPGGPDLVSPSITSLQPTGTITTSSTTVSAGYSDAGSGINAATATLTVSGATVSGCSASATQISCTASGLADGTHTITVSVADNAGNTGSASGTFTVTSGPDTSPPVITNVQPSGTIYTTSTTISADYSDPSGINTGSNMVHVDGRMLSGCTVTATHVSCAKSGLALGQHKIEIYIDDSVGNNGYSLTYFTVAAADTTAPAVTNLQPSGTVNSDTVTVSADYIDSGSGINASTASLIVSGASVSGCTADAAHIICTASGMAVGSHTISASVADNSGNTGSASGSFTVAQAPATDSTAPVVSNILPAGTVSGDSQTVSASYSDSGSGINAATASLTVSGATVSGCVADAAHISCTASGLASGSHTISVSVADNAGNTGTGSSAFGVVLPDTTAPVVTSVTPVDGSTIYTNSGQTIYYQQGNATPLTIKADYTDEAGGSGVDTVSVMVHLDISNMLFNCVAATATHTECTANPDDMTPGTHPVDIYVDDLAGNQTIHRSWVTVVTDSAAPSYANLAPAAGSIIYTSQLNSVGTNDMAALRFDYDILDATPTSSVVPMSHVNDSVPPGITGAMISNTSCVKTPDALNTIHYSCQVNRAKLLHLGDNTLSILLKDRVGNQSADYSSAAGLSHYTVVDDMAPEVSGLTASAAGIRAYFSDPQPAGALSTSLSAGINSGSAQALIDGTIDAGTCAATAAGIECATPAGLSPGTHTVTVSVLDNAGNKGMSSGSLTIDAPPCAAGKPMLSLGSPAPYWASYQDYQARVLSVSWAIANSGTTGANNVTMTASTPGAGVTLVSSLPAVIGNIGGGTSGNIVLRYQLPAGIHTFRVVNAASAEDECGNSYAFP